MSFLGFYAWARGLENNFDATHRNRLHDVITRELLPEETEHVSDEIEEPLTLALGGSPNNNGTLKLPDNLVVGGTGGIRKRLGAGIKTPSYNDDLILVDGKATLVRLPVFAFFHNHSAKTLNGAPHSFSAFLHSYPSLPQVCIFFNLRIVGIPHTNDEERYVVSRVRSFEGIYVATMRVGYRDPIDLSNIAEPIKNRILAIENSGHGVSEEDKKERTDLIENAARLSVTHM